MEGIWKKALRIGLSAILVIAVGADAFAQGRQTGILRGTAEDLTGLVLPGVTITVRSESLQGTRTTWSGITGNYEIQGLPPGTYTVLFRMTGFAEVEDTATVSLGTTSEVSVSMQPAFQEAALVVEVVPPELASTEGSANSTAAEVNALPVGRDIVSIAELAPGVTNNTPNDGQLTISGAFGYDNMFLVDGVDVNDNIFGTAHDLFIEDSIEETQVLTSGISSEYGRFSGGVVNTITKSGGNTFSGSFRANLYKPDWTARTPFERQNEQVRTGDLGDNTTYETTVGGPIMKDRLWFFYSNRAERVAEDQTFNETGIGHERTTKNDRNQIKLTGTLTQGHTLQGNYMRNSTAQQRPSFGFSIDPATVINRTVPNDLWVATYRGAATNQLFTEFQVSQKRLGFRDNGGLLTDIRDSPFITLTQQLAHFNAPYFDAGDPQDRDNRQFTGSATYYLDTASVGTHSLKAGFEHFRSTLRGGGSQSATGFVFDADYGVGAGGEPLLDTDGRLIPVFQPFATLLEDWRPVRGATLNIDTLSFYLNDSWTLGRHFSFNLGLRSEKASSEATGDITGLDTNRVVPRLAAAVDPIGDGRYTIQATYGHYAGRHSEAQFNQNTSVARPDLLLGLYTGPAGQGRDFAPGFDPDNYMTVFGLFPNQNVFFDDGISSPLTKEFTISGGATLGSRGHTRVTYLHRKMSDVVEDFFTLDGGATTVTGPDGQAFGRFENQIFMNTDALFRTYDAMMFQGQYRLTDNFVLDGSWTVQLRNEGNFEGESPNRPAIASPAFDYPEVTPEFRYYPTGRLDEFQGHKARVWGIYNLPVGTSSVDIGGIWRYNSGRSYSIAANGQGLSDTQSGIINSLGYAGSPDSRTLFFETGRGSETFDGYGLFDLSVQYSIPVWESLRPWFKAEVYNVFNNSKQIFGNVSVVPDPDSPLDDLGLPTGYIEGPRFGEATSSDNYPQWLPGLDGLRTIRFSLGFRF